MNGMPRYERRDPDQLLEALITHTLSETPWTLMDDIPVCKYCHRIQRRNTSEEQHNKGCLIVDVRQTNHTGFRRELAKRRALRRETQYCPSCAQHLPRDEFYIDISRSTGLCGYCKKCKNRKTTEQTARRKQRQAAKMNA